MLVSLLQPLLSCVRLSRVRWLSGVIARFAVLLSPVAMLLGALEMPAEGGVAFAFAMALVGLTMLMVYAGGMMMELHRCYTVLNTPSDTHPRCTHPAYMCLVLVLVLVLVCCVLVLVLVLVLEALA